MADADVMGISSVREIGIAVKFLFVVTEHALAWGAYPNISFLVFQYGGNPCGDGLPFIGLSVQERKYVGCRIGCYAEGHSLCNRIERLAGRRNGSARF